MAPVPLVGRVILELLASAPVLVTALVAFVGCAVLGDLTVVDDAAPAL
jgi:hypothetical protein